MPEFAVGRLELLLALLAFGARRARNLQYLELHASTAIAQLGATCTRNLCDLLHDAGQHPDAIPQQARVGWIMDVGLYHRCVHAHSSSFDPPLLPGYSHNPGMDLFERLGPHCHTPATHRLGVGYLAAAHARKVAVHQIGAHLALQHLIAPVARVLEDQQAQDQLSGHTFATEAAALGVALCQGLVHSGYDLFVGQDAVSGLHPIIAKVAHFLGDQTIAEAELSAAHLNHACLPVSSR